MNCRERTMRPKCTPIKSAIVHTSLKVGYYRKRKRLQTEICSGHFHCFDYRIDSVWERVELTIKENN